MEMPYIFEFNIPAEYVYNNRPDEKVTVKAKFLCEYSDNSIAVLCSFVDMNLYQVGCVKNWPAVSRLIEERAIAFFRQHIQPQHGCVGISEQKYALTA